MGSDEEAALTSAFQETFPEAVMLTCHKHLKVIKASHVSDAKKDHIATMKSSAFVCVFKSHP